MIKKNENTPMQELLEHLTDVEDAGALLGNETTYALTKAVIISVKKIINEEYLEKEEQLIIHAWNMGNDWGVHGDPQEMPNGKVYFYYKYKENK